MKKLLLIFVCIFSCLLLSGCDDIKTIECTVGEVSATMTIKNGKLDSFSGTLNIENYIRNNIANLSKDTRHTIMDIEDYIKNNRGGTCIEK